MLCSPLVLALIIEEPHLAPLQTSHPSLSLSVRRCADGTNIVFEPKSPSGSGPEGDPSETGRHTGMITWDDNMYSGVEACEAVYDHSRGLGSRQQKCFPEALSPFKLGLIELIWRCLGGSPKLME